MNLSRFLDLFQCPISGEPLTASNGVLVTASGSHRYEVDARGIPHFVHDLESDAARVQQNLYDGIVDRYLANLTYPHTAEYMAYLDRQVLDRIVGSPLNIAEICCGAGEACWLLRDRVGRAVGIDVSIGMLERACLRLPGEAFVFAQGDACRLPLVDAKFDAVFMLGGIHHVNDRPRLFSEVARILKRGGRFYFREPLDDFIVWRALRSLVYRMSSMLDGETERPLRRRPTMGQLTAAGLTVETWHPVGFLGWCVLMNSDVLVVNRLLRFVPGIRPFTRFMTRADEVALTLPGLHDVGTQVVGIAVKP